MFPTKREGEEKKKTQGTHPAGAGGHFQAQFTHASQCKNAYVVPQNHEEHLDAGLSTLTPLVSAIHCAPHLFYSLDQFTPANVLHFNTKLSCSIAMEIVGADLQPRALPQCLNNFILNTITLLKANNFACFDSLVLKVSFLSFSMLITWSCYVYNCIKIFSLSTIVFDIIKKKNKKMDGYDKTHWAQSHILLLNKLVCIRRLFWPHPEHLHKYRAQASLHRTRASFIKSLFGWAKQMFLFIN